MAHSYCKDVMTTFHSFLTDVMRMQHQISGPSWLMGLCSWCLYCWLDVYKSICALNVYACLLKSTCVDFGERIFKKKVTPQDSFRLSLQTAAAYGYSQKVAYTHHKCYSSFGLVMIALNCYFFPD